MGDWLTGGMLTGIVLSLVWFLLTKVLPRKAAERAARPYEQTLTTIPGVEGQPVVAVDVESSLTSSKVTHDVFLEEADDLLLQARGAGLFVDPLLAEAAEKVADALKLRPGSFAANMMAGEIGVKRAMISDGSEAIGLLERAAVSFATASQTKKGVIDAYVGRAWAHLERGGRLDGEDAVAAYLAAVEVFLTGFRVSPQNLFILRGWGIAIDGLARTIGERADSVVAAEEAYRLALAEHRGGDHELHRWFAGIRSSAEPTEMPMPAVRDRY